MGAQKFISPKWHGLLVSIALAGCGGGGSSSGGPVGTSPNVTLSVNSGNVAPGDSVTLNWQSQNTTSCTASGGWQGSRATSGSETVGPLNSDQNFRLSCSGSGAGVMQEVSVNVTSTNTVMVYLDVG